MDEPREDVLRRDLGAEYYAIDAKITDFDNRALTVKGWSVTISLAGIGLGFQQEHYALFAVASLSALSFWLVGGILKRQQMGYYARMREIEVVAFHLNHLAIGGRAVSAPQINWWWWNSGHSDERPGDEPLPREMRAVARGRRRAWLLVHVLLPEALIGLVGLVLFFVAASTDLLGDLQP